MRSFGIQINFLMVFLRVLLCGVVRILLEVFIFVLVLCLVVVVGVFLVLLVVDYFDDFFGCWFDCDVDFVLGLCLGIGWVVNIVIWVLLIQEMELSWNCVWNYCVRIIIIFYMYGYVEIIDDWIKNFFKFYCLLRLRWVRVELLFFLNWVENFSKKIVFNQRVFVLYFFLMDIYLYDDQFFVVFKGESCVVFLFVCFVGVQFIVDEFLF